MNPRLSLLRTSLPWRLALPAYALALAIATHWPRLVIDGPVARSDLYIHVAAFGVLGGLLALAALFGQPASRRNLALSWAIGVAFAATDELTQSIPVLGRTAGWDDFLADVAGVTLGVLTGGGLARVLGYRSEPKPPMN